MDGLMLTAPDGSVLDANPAACRMFGRTRDEVIEAGRKGLIDSSDPRLAKMIEERKRTGKSDGELTARKKDGTSFPIEISSQVFTTPEGEARSCMIIRDISQRRAAQVELETVIRELRETLGRVKYLSGLLPICAACKKIRDQDGSWQTLEVYIRDHSNADFSHGICPECRRNLYPEHTRD